MIASQVLLVDDDPGVLQVTKGLLSEGGYQVFTAKNAIEAIELLDQHVFDAVLIDHKMPGPSGLVLAERTRELQASCAIIMFSASATRDHVIEALRADVDDYLIKPLTGEPLRQAVGRAILKYRRSSQKNEPPPRQASELIMGGLKIDIETHTVLWHDHPLDLTPTEYCLLITLAQNMGQSVSASALVRRCRGYAAPEMEARTLLKPHIANLRQKLEQDGQFERILVNHRGVGFILHADRKSS